MLDVCAQWFSGYKPLLDKEKYADDILVDAMALLGGVKGNEDVADFLKKHGVEVRPFTEPPKPPKPSIR
jgi:hypothetical protein